MCRKLKAGVMNMAKQIMENESRIVEAKCDLAKYCIEKISNGIDKAANGIDKVVGNKDCRKVLACTCIGFAVGLILVSK